MKKVGKVLVVDDNAGIRSALKILLPMRFEAVEILPSPALLISTVNAFQPDVILLDMNFNTDINTGNEGLFWLSELRNNNPNQKVVLFTAYADISLAVEGMKRGAFDFIVKPWENEKLLATLERAVTENRKDSRQSNEYATGPTGMYWGTSQAMAEIKKTIEKIGPTDATVLITGENGTGKDLLAREIHNHSERRNGPMVSVDAGAIPETLFESELFGHVKGAFTDAYADKAGKVELAEGGTLFLDEIGNIPLHLQAKLLRGSPEQDDHEGRRHQATQCEHPPCLRHEYGSAPEGAGRLVQGGSLLQDQHDEHPSAGPEGAPGRHRSARGDIHKKVRREVPPRGRGHRSGGEGRFEGLPLEREYS